MITLRPEQVNTVTHVRTRESITPRVRLCVQSPTGTGKSVIMSALLMDDKPQLVLTHRRVLIDQLARVLDEFGIPYGFRVAGKELNPAAPIQLAMVQTEYQRAFRRGSIPLHPCQRLHVDELHQIKGTTAQAIMDRYRAEGAAIIGYTATPVDLGGVVDECHVSITVSKAIERGYLCPPLVFSIEQPNPKAIEQLRTDAKGEFLPKDIDKLVHPDRIKGRVIQHYKRLSPDGRAFILFAQSVKKSIWWAQYLSTHGLPTAHIDGDNLWVDGKFFKSDSAKRQEVFDRVSSGDIRGLSNRFVLREGVDLPCVARDTKILTNLGEIPIQDVTKNHLLWDGVEWVRHGGPVCKGFREVVTRDGLTATPEHKVHTINGWKKIIQICGAGRITTSGIGGHAVRVLDRSDPHGTLQGIPPVTNRGTLRGLQRHILDRLPLFSTKNREALRAMQAVESRIPTSAVAVPASNGPIRTMFGQIQSCLCLLWRTWYRISIREQVGGCGLGKGSFGHTRRPEYATRSHRQRRSLRAGQFAVGNSFREYAELSTEEIPQQLDSSVQNEPSGSTLRRQAFVSATHEVDRFGDCHSLEFAEVWDILDCGPRHRYTANGKLVANCIGHAILTAPVGSRMSFVQMCGRVLRPYKNREYAIIQDHSGTCIRHPVLDSDEPWDWILSAGLSERMYIARMRENEDPEPIICPQCNLMRYVGDTCPFCGFVYRKHARFVEQTDGELRLVEGKQFRPRNVSYRSGDAKLWERAYWGAMKNSPHRTMEQIYTYIAVKNNWYWLRRDLPGMPKESWCWFVPVKDVPNHLLIPWAK